jgi:cellulose 1,4-beta-cellobiosidase
MIDTLVIALMAAADENVFAAHGYHIDATYQERVRVAMKARWAEGSALAGLSAARAVPSAFWVDTISRIGRHADGRASMRSLLSAAAGASPPSLVVFVLYNLPNRDCHAHASNGELCCEYAASGIAADSCVYDTRDARCSAGLTAYKHEYVDAFVAELVAQPSVPVAVVLEPDSLPNLATNLNDPRCGNAATRTAYVEGVSYAIGALSREVPRAALYLDAGHGGWLGWPEAADQFIQIVSQLPYRQLRGFASNVANYQPLGEPCPASAFAIGAASLVDFCNSAARSPCCDDPCGKMAEHNQANNEHNYVQFLSARARHRLPDFQPRSLIDTGRNGVSGMRHDCAHWCNIRGAGLGREPSAKTSLPGLVDA